MYVYVYLHIFLNSALSVLFQIRKINKEKNKKNWTQFFRISIFHKIFNKLLIFYFTGTVTYIVHLFH